MSQRPSPSDGVSLAGHIRLSLYTSTANDDSHTADTHSVYLEIPIQTIQSLCHHPRKYLRYLGWCVLGVDGYISLHLNGSALLEEGSLEEQTTYYYRTERACMLYLRFA